MSDQLNRRHFLAAVSTVGSGLLLPAWARGGPDGTEVTTGITPVAGNTFDLSVRAMPFRLDGRDAHSVVVNGQLPAPLLRWREGDDLTIRVTNHLKEDTSIHWHGLLLPYRMDGVPGVSFAGIKPGETFTYRFPLRQAGTYWYHSHSGLQEQLGHYGPIIIDPGGEDPVRSDREYVIVLSDWTFEHPHDVYRKLKHESGVYNRQKRSLRDFRRDVRTRGWSDAFEERLMWGRMRMDPADIADVSGATYTYLINGHSPLDNWTGLFRPGERVRLRFINASAMSIFNVRIPGLGLEIVQADGLNVVPVATDEFQIGVAETFDAVIQPGDQAYTIYAESNDASGFARATLAPRVGLVAPLPLKRERPTLTMKDMAMGHRGHAHHTNHRVRADDHPQGPGVVGRAEQPVNRLFERPVGLQDVPHRVLVYGDLKGLDAKPDVRAPEQEIEIHLTSNMERYMWSFDGVKFSDAPDPIRFRKGERVRLILINDTMMPHPIHLHGMFFELVLDETAPQDPHAVRKHTVVVKPGERMAVDVSADAPGEWAFHCHLLYHMHAGMMRVVRVGDAV